jgi:hypothetical protein
MNIEKLMVILGIGVTAFLLVLGVLVLIHSPLVGG